MPETTIAQRPKFGEFMTMSGTQDLITGTLKDLKRAQRFTASIISAYTLNPALEGCDFRTVLSCALLGESLGLSPSPQLGQYYMVPFEQKEKRDKNGNVISPARKVATFILGYKGYIQMAIRSGQYRNIDVKCVKKGEIVRIDEFNDDYVFSPLKDYFEREAAETVGYYATLEYQNGFKKAMFWPKEKMLQHASRYSAAFGPAPARGNYPGRVSHADYAAGNYNKKDEWAYSSFWYKDFDGMAQKTMLRQLISKWGVMSPEFADAFDRDGSVGATVMLNTGEPIELGSSPETPALPPYNYDGYGGSYDGIMYVENDAPDEGADEIIGDAAGNAPPQVSMADL